MITDPAGIIVYVNRAWTRTTGYSTNEVVGKSPRMIKSDVHSREFYEKLWMTILAGHPWRGRLTNRRRDGQLFYEDKTITPIRDENGEITHFLSTAKDVTEEVRLEAQLRQAQKMEALGVLASGVAHDFNNLLTVIVGHVTLALTEARGSSMEVYLEEACKASFKASELTAQLLSFGRRGECEAVSVDLNEVADEVAAMLRRIIGEDISLDVRLCSTPMWVTCVPGQLDQVLMNLAVNARDAMPEGGKVTITSQPVVLDESLAGWRSVEPGEYVMFAVSDDGRGMSRETLARACEPFFTTKADDGTGLGLSTVSAIVSEFGGSLWIDSEPGVGTTVTFLLPRTSDVPEAIIEDPIEPEMVGGTGRVLVVEDNSHVRSLVQDILQQGGYEVVTAKSGEVALETCAVRGFEPDLLVTDIVLPGVNGVELARQFAELQPGIRVLYMSGYGDRSPGGLGTPTHLGKPFTPAQLLGAVRHTMDAA